MIRKDESAEFIEFWEKVWRPHARHTDGRGAARDAFNKHVRTGADPQDIVDGARYFFRTMKERDREFVPLVASWLNRGAFEDTAEQERAHQARMAEAQQRRNEAAGNVVDIRQQPMSEDERARREQMVRAAKASIGSAAR